MIVDSDSSSRILTPLGASLDEQYNTPTKGPPKNGCSFEDDLSLGAEANLLQNGSAKPDPSYEMQAKEKRSQFRQKGRSMNSTGSGKSSGTVSSVSELLDLYEEDPEEILYNLGFGREEPDIASKIPSRFFNSSSSAKGIDIKVYLGAQIQRMELENPNYALTSRFRQTEVLATVANVFTEIYSQVSGRPLEKICQIEQQPKEPAPLQRNNSALNVAKILKRNFSRSNLTNSAEGTQASPVSATTSDSESHSDSEPKPMKSFRKKDTCLATVKEETHQGDVEVSSDAKEANSAFVNGQQSSSNTTEETEAVLEVTDNPVLVNGTKMSEQCQSGIADGKEKVSSATYVDKEPCSFLPNPHMAHLLDQPKDSFEMEELQSNEDEAVAMTCFSRTCSEPLLRTASQQSDSSGFAEDPTTEGSANFLKVQESLDSCDSETTVTSHTGGEATLEHPSFENIIGDEELLIQPGMGLFSPAEVHQKDPERVGQEVSERCVMDQTRTENPKVAGSELQITSRHSVSVIETSSSTESESTIESAGPASSTDPNSFPNVPNMGEETMPVGEQNYAGQLMSTTEADSTTKTISSTFKPVLGSESVPSSGPLDEQASGPVPEPKSCNCQDLSNSQRVRGALLQAHQRSSSCEDSRGRVWVRSKDLLRDVDDRVRNPLKRSSSLPTSLQSPTRVVSSMRIQLGQGSVRHCTPPCYSYRYDEERDSIAEEDEAEAQPGSRSKLLHNPTECDSVGLNPETPPYPLNVPQHLTRSASSLYSTPADWPLRRMAEGPAWSTNSVPDLSQHAGMPHPAIPRHIQQELPYFRGSFSSPYGKSLTPPSRSSTPLNNSYSYAQTGMYSQYPQPQNSTFSYPPYTPPHGTPFAQPYTHPQNVGYHPSAAIHSPPPCNPYGSTYSLHGSPYNPQVPLPHSYSAPCSLACSNLPYHPNVPCGHPYNTSFHPPPAPFPGDTSTSPPTMSSTEMQLRRVLHEIRGTVQSISQNASAQRGGTPSGTHGAHQAVQPLLEELQRRRRSLNLFRTQMMDLEMTLMRQQSMVYQLLTSDERHEVEQLQRLRIAVRQELQELELQLEHQFFTLDDPLHSARSSRLYQYPQSMSRGHSMESLSSSSALKATETVSDLLREQMFLQSELGCGSGAPTSACSSRSASPVRPCRSDDFSSLSSKRGRGEVFRASVSLTPSIASRSGAQSQERSTTQNATSCTTEVREQRVAQTATNQEERESMSDEDHQLQEDRGGEEAGGNVPMQQLIQQIKQSLADEIRQEIVSEFLAAMSQGQSPGGTRGQTP